MIRKEVAINLKERLIEMDYSFSGIQAKHQNKKLNEYHWRRLKRLARSLEYAMNKAEEQGLVRFRGRS